jgi:hypothetical protein
MKFLKNFLLLWVIFALLDLDPIRIRIRNPDQAQQHHQLSCLFSLVLESTASKAMASSEPFLIELRTSHVPNSFVQIYPFL